MNPIVVNTAINRGGRDKMRKNVVFSVTFIDSSGSAANTPIRNPLASIVKRQAAKAVRNLPPKSPSRGPEGWITRQTPSRSNLEKKEKKYIITRWGGCD